MAMRAVTDNGLPDLDRYLEARGRRFVTYAEGAEIYQIPYYSFVRLAKEAGANYTMRKSVIIDIDIIERYLEEHPQTMARVLSVRRA